MYVYCVPVCVCVCVYMRVCACVLEKAENTVYICTHVWGHEYIHARCGCWPAMITMETNGMCIPVAWSSFNDAPCHKFDST